MKKYALALLCFFSIYACAEEDCSNYWLTTSVIGNTLRYDLSKNGTVEPPQVDSIWITNGEEQDVPIIVLFAQSGEAIDISMLDQGLYLLWVRIGNCLHCRQFGKREVSGTMLTSTYAGSNSCADKILRDGQLLIDRNGELFTVDGRKL